MKGIFDRLTGKKKSANQAKERLKLVLIHDRTDLSPGLMEALRDDIIGVISRHLDIDATGVHLEMAHEGRHQRLIADIPLRQIQRRG
jgi:cell division topological specificity factor